LVTADQYSMYSFSFKLKQTLHSNTPATSKGRVFIEFPIGPVGSGFQADLGTTKISGNKMPCNYFLGGVLDADVECRILVSPGTNIPTKIEILGFGSIPAATEITLYVVMVKNPVSKGEYE